MGEKIDIHHTLFAPYETIILDLDGVVWDCFQSNGQGTGCYTAVSPFKREAGNIVTASNGVVIRLQEGIEDLLRALDDANKNLGIVSRSEAPGVPFAAQPAVMLLKQYGLYKYFNYDVILKLGMNKAEYVKPNGKTLFIDDDQQNLEGVNQRDQVDVLWRKSFTDWRQTLSPVQSHLNFSFMRLGWEMEEEKYPQLYDVWWEQEAMHVNPRSRSGRNAVQAYVRTRNGGVYSFNLTSIQPILVGSEKPWLVSGTVQEKDLVALRYLYGDSLHIHRQPLRISNLSLT